jgi:hypothetical protein
MKKWYFPVVLNKYVLVSEKYQDHQPDEFD